MTGLVTCLICRIPLGFFMTFIYVVFYYLNYAVVYSSLAISTLRVAAVVKPIDSDQVCVKLALMDHGRSLTLRSFQLQIQLSRILLLVVYLLPTLTTWFLIPSQAFFTPISNSASLGIDYEKIYPKVSPNVQFTVKQ